MDDFAEWRSIRPWRPTLALSIREITSVSVTFILSSPYSSDPISPLSMSSDEDGESGSEDECEHNRTQIISDVLAKGLSVKVNGIPWQRVLIKVDEETDEAVIILFGLMPGRQYDVELGVVLGERTLRGQITTDSELHSDSSRLDHLTEEAVLLNTSLSSSASSQALSASPSHTSPSSSPSAPVPMPTPAPLTLEARRQQLSHELAALNTEHVQLTAALKTARKEAQKADAALRQEIDILKRAAERGAAGEQRAKQKVLALREARKQTEAAAEAIEEARKEIEVALPGLEQRALEVEEALGTVRQRAAEKRREREEAEATERRRREEWVAEIGALGRTLEKLAVRREKLEGSGEGEGGTIGELEEKLRRLEEERERIERDPFGYEGEAGGKDGDGFQENEDPIVESEGRATSRSDHQSVSGGSSQGHNHPNHPHHNSNHGAFAHAHHHHPHQHSRKRHSHPHTQHSHHTSFALPRSSGRVDASQSHSQSQTLPPIQRPPHSARLSLPSHRELSAGPGIIHLQAPASISTQAPKSNGSAHANGHTGRAHSNSGSGSASGSGSSAASSPAPPATASNLSSRAPPFEPSGLGLGAARSTQTAATVSSKSELNPGSSPFSPRSTAAQAATSAHTRPRGGST
ncbi:hypothetical protein DAEQUDRAFT_725379 [Daedalea quercina L-15889]|uniref:Uncharacterized protein n=1 Tax=Daedalea quercina L-15889 TaxID=1314783 RepID=A0A165R915_9APHY|nr:hypothetical protein DAEQUDRAFT_725379 [Daedalea quercina L-15889]